MQEEQIPAGEFKAHCLSLMDQVAQTRQAVTITKHGKPVARLVPLDTEPVSLFGCLAGTASIQGDLTLPLDENWDADN